MTDNDGFMTDKDRSSEFFSKILIFLEKDCLKFQLKILNVLTSIINTFTIFIVKIVGKGRTTCCADTTVTTKLTVQTDCKMTSIFIHLHTGMDDKEDPEMMITLEAMSGLTKILALLDEPAVRQIMINICLRIRPCFEKESAEVRAAAILLFGNLSRFGEGMFT